MNSILDIPGASGISPRDAAASKGKYQLDPVTQLLADYITKQEAQQKALQAAQNPALNKSVLEEVVEKTVGGMMGGALGALQGAMPQIAGQMGPQMGAPAPQGMPPAQGGIGGLDFAPTQMADGGIVGYAAGDPVMATESARRLSEAFGNIDFTDPENADILEQLRAEEKRRLAKQAEETKRLEAQERERQLRLTGVRNFPRAATPVSVAAADGAAAAAAGRTSGTPTPTPTPTPSGATAGDLTSPYTRGNFVPIGPGIEATALQVVPGATVTSRGRTPTKNAQVGGVADSFHLLDSARDFVPGNSGLSMSQLAAQLKEAFGPDFDVVNEGDHVHVEPGPTMGARLRAEAEGAGLPTAAGAPQGLPGFRIVENDDLGLPAGTPISKAMALVNPEGESPFAGVMEASQKLMDGMKDEFAPVAESMSNILQTLKDKNTPEAIKRRREKDLSLGLAEFGFRLASTGKIGESALGTMSELKKTLEGREGEQLADLARIAEVQGARADIVLKPLLQGFQTSLAEAGMKQKEIDNRITLLAQWIAGEYGKEASLARALQAARPDPFEPDPEAAREYADEMLERVITTADSLQAFNENVASLKLPQQAIAAANALGEKIWVEKATMDDPEVMRLQDQFKSLIRTYNLEQQLESWRQAQAFGGY